MAGVVRSLGRGGQRFVERVLGWSRGTVRKGGRDLDAGGDAAPERFGDRGRKPAEHHLPHLLEDIFEIVEPCSQTDPTFRTTQIYRKITAAAVREKLVDELGYGEDDLPSVRTISSKLALLDFKPCKVAKTKPLKKIPQTDAIFGSVHAANARADAAPRELRISLDTKTAAYLGPYARGGESRQKQEASDHDLGRKEKLVPFGVLLPGSKESFVWMAQGKVTSDFMADRLGELFPALLERCPGMETLVINADNGPECSGRRTQWLKRLVDLAEGSGVKVELAYYPPYHSKYNPVERYWGVLENYWRGELLETVEKAVGLVRGMTYAGIHPVVELVKDAYESGVTVAKAEMAKIEAKLKRKPGLENWSIEIEPKPRLG